MQCLESSPARCVVLTLSLLLSVSGVCACTIVFKDWLMRSNGADPLFRFEENGKAGYIDVSGNVRVPPTLPIHIGEPGEFHEGLLALRANTGFRYITPTGDTVLQADVDSAGDFSEQLAPAREQAKEHLWGFINRSGRFAIPPQFGSARPYSEGLAAVRAPRPLTGTGYVDKQGRFVIPAHLTFGSDFHEGLAAAVVDGPCRVRNAGSCDNVEFEPTQPDARYRCGYTFIDRAGRPFSDQRFDNAFDFSEGLAAVRIGKLWGFVDKLGQFAIKPQFPIAKPFSEGLAVASDGSYLGYIDHGGNWIIPPQFRYAGAFSDGRALVIPRDAGGPHLFRFIDKQGQQAFPGAFGLASGFRHGLAHVRPLDGPTRRRAWINISGNEVFVYDKTR